MFVSSVSVRGCHCCVIVVSHQNRQVNSGFGVVDIGVIFSASVRVGVSAGFNANVKSIRKERVHMLRTISKPVNNNTYIMVFRAYPDTVQQSLIYPNKFIVTFLS